MNDTERELRRMCREILETVREYARQIEDPEVDEPTVGEVPVCEYPYAVTAEVGRPWEVLLAGGGPIIVVTADGFDSARLEGLWGGDRVTLFDPAFDVLLDHLTGRGEYSRGTCRCAA